MKKPYMIALFAALAILLSPERQALAEKAGDEAIELLDKTKIIGKLVHYFDGIVTFKLPGGASIKLPLAKIRKISFKLPKPRKKFSTPEKVFHLMRKAGLKEDLGSYIDCHSTSFQIILHQQVLIAKPREFAKQLRKNFEENQLKILSSKIKGDTATLRIRSSRGEESSEGEFHFVRENGEWKIILPLGR